jgi:hypothetical protein
LVSVASSVILAVIASPILSSAARLRSGCRWAWRRGHPGVVKHLADGVEAVIKLCVECCQKVGRVPIFSGGPNAIRELLVKLSIKDEQLRTDGRLHPIHQGE